MTNPPVSSSKDDCRTAADLASSIKGFLVAWGVPILLFGVTANASDELLVPWISGILFSVAMTWGGISCLVNAKRCGRVHCTVTGPVFLVLAVVSWATVAGVSHIRYSTLGNMALLVLGASLVPELFGKRYFHVR